MSTVLLHIGYHKTGTTWLQRGLFATAPFVQPFTSIEIRDAIVGATDFQFDPASARRVLAPASSGPTVISDERLSGSPHAGGYDSARIAHRLVRTFPDARVLIVVREQRSVILAVYQQYVRDGGVAPLEKYLRPRNPWEVPQFRIEHFEYDLLIEYYRELFSPDRVLAVPYEHLREDAGAFAAQICDFAGIECPDVDPSPRYEGWGSLAIAFKRQFNRLFVRNSLNPGAPMYVKDHEARAQRLTRILPRHVSRRQRDEVDRFLGSHFVESNRRLTNLVGTDLGALGYMVS